MTLVVPMPENLANARLHWRAKDRKRQAYYATLDTLAKIPPQKIMGIGYEVPPPPATPPTLTGITATLYLGAKMDTGNAMNRMKWIEDWLRDRGYIVDDKEAHLKWLEFPKQVVKRGQVYRVAITLTPLTPSEQAAA